MFLKRYNLALALLMIAMSISVACDSGKKAAATAAISTADTAYSAISDQAQKYVPDQAKAVQDTITAAKTSLTNGDYEAALNSAKDLPGKLKDLAEAIKAKKDELTAKWNEMSGSMPGLVTAAQAKMDALKKAHKLPAGAADGMANMKQTWSDAASAFSSGDLSSAMDKASAAKEKLTSLQQMMGMKPAMAATQ